MTGGSTPGIWQDDRAGYVLAHVREWHWQDGINNSGVHRKILRVIYVSGADFHIIDQADAESFVRAVNLYWETRA